jgi:anti-anti-sigma factor
MEGVLPSAKPEAITKPTPNRLYEDVQLRISRNRESGWLSFSGEIDSWNVDAVRAVLEKALQGDGDVRVDVSQLLFCDVTGIRALVAVSGKLTAGRRVVLHGLDPRLQRVFGVIGWGQLPSLLIETEAGVN